MYETILHLLAEKKEAFLLCEGLTSSMCVCPLEELELYMEQRQQALDRVEELNGRIRALYAGNKTVRAAVENSCDRGGLSIVEGRIYDASLAAKTVVNRILQHEGTVRERLEQEKANALAQIKRINSSSSTVAERYFKSVSTGISNPVTTRKGKFI